MSMTTVPHLLGAAYGGVYRVKAPPDLGRLTGLAKLKGLQLFRADCSAVCSKHALLATIARALRFPAYFGMNWDALADCLTDLEWLDADGIVLVLTGASRMAARAPRDFAVALEVLQEAADYWAGEGFPFVVLVNARAGSATAALPAVRVG
jgi:RNAse (barnase) inhibitor barstar